MNTRIRSGLRQAVGALCLVICSSSAFRSTMAIAREPDWYSDVQYLTWNESMVAPEGRHATVGPEREVHLQVPNESRVTETNGRGNDLLAVCRRQIDCVARRIAEQARRSYGACANSCQSTW